MNASAQVCAVTGANGYLGSRVAAFFTDRGWSVCEFTRRDRTATGRLLVPLELGAQVQPEQFSKNNVQALVHCAYDFRPTRWDQIRRINVDGSLKLLRAASEAGVKNLVYISSISAFKGCRSMYGQAKLEIEKAAADLGAVIIRPGLIYADSNPGSMFASLQRAVTKSSIVPLIGSGRYVQYLIHESDLCEVIFRAASGKLPRRAPITVASPTPWPLRDLLSALASAHGVKVRFFPVPWQLIWAGAKSLEVFRLPSPFRSDSVISLVRQDPHPAFTSAKELGCRIREFTATSGAAYSEMHS